MRIFVEEGFASHDHGVQAKAALRSLVLDERSLEWVKRQIGSASTSQQTLADTILEISECGSADVSLLSANGGG
jgi:hypothetical protein